ncbi:MAG: hydrogen peroxide-inducible genes activator [Nitratireductor sp.]|nr:hydrogen peroxide-inducible genes activator [Nitratireductor sp.]
MNLTLRQLQYFEVLSRTRHFARAAERVHVSQPALSAQVLEMEKRLGGRLFERSRAGVWPTPLAEKLLPIVRRMLDDARSIEEIAAAGPGSMTGRLRLGIIPTIAPYILPGLVPKAAETWPALKLEIRESITQALLEALQSREIDLVLAALPLQGDGLETCSLFRDRFVIATGGGRDLLVGPVAVDDIPPERLLLLAEGHCLRDQALDVCGLRSDARLVNFEASSLTTLVQLVASGMGMTLLPEMAVASENRDGKLRLLDFADPKPSRDIGLAWRRASERREEFAALGDLITACIPGQNPSGRG